MGLSKLLSAYENDMYFTCGFKGCTRRATHVLIAHNFDHCKDSETPNRVYVSCFACGKRALDKVVEKYDRMKAAVVKGGNTLECVACGMEVRKMGDVVRLQRLVYVM